MQFSDLGIAPLILRALDDAGYTEPTPVQAQAIPAAIAGHDLLVSAQTGSGKTAAFLLPSLVKLSERSTQSGKGPRVLVLTPTRELAQQVEKNAIEYGTHLRWLRTVCLVGGSSFGFQVRAMSKPIDIMVATPGRLMDHMRQGRIDFSRLEMLVLDEADRMLDMGFIEDIETIVQATPSTRQTVMFSATLDGIVGKLAQRMTHDAQRIERPVPLPNICCTLTIPVTRIACWIMSCAKPASSRRSSLRPPRLAQKNWQTSCRNKVFLQHACMATCHKTGVTVRLTICAAAGSSCW